ncbi:hypothetical protein [Tissierella praeacuta]|uniref:hypothetical protein n=1 Tax=Tissierella praeacuta TaxID=43131 RepID=UPI0028A7ECA2|nr:hypothetical protein [Tissierella praeacuta]
MWIRNQSRTGLVDVSSLDVEGKKVMCRNWILGEYETEKRAMEVLDEIQDHLNDYKNGYRETFEMPEK